MYVSIFPSLYTHYKVGLFGKYLNVCPADPPPGFDAWYANGGSTYYSPFFHVKNIEGLPDGPLQYNATDYSTSLIGNYSLAWIRSAAQDYKKTGQPFFAYIGTKANHDPFHAAPWYKDTWDPSWPSGAPRTPNWNVSQAVLSKHHPTVASRGPFGEDTATCIDANFKVRSETRRETEKGGEDGGLGMALGMALGEALGDARGGTLGGTLGVNIQRATGILMSDSWKVCERTG